MSFSADGRFTLEPGGWYGLTMFPGYVDCPYHSPIRVDEIRPLGGRYFDLKFLNLRYAIGVQDFQKHLKTLRRAKSHIIAEDTEVADRTYVITKLNKSWLRTHEPQLNPDRFFDRDGDPIERFLLDSSAGMF